jgi:ABC-2 type transport system permease protein
MKKIGYVALREFLATVATKGFIIGVLITPLMIGIVIVAMKWMITKSPPKIRGEVAVIDPSGQVTDGIADYLRPEAIAERRQEFLARIRGEATERLGPLAEAGGGAARQEIERMLGEVAELTIVPLPVGTDVEEAKRPLLEGDQEGGGRLVVAVIHEDAVVAREDGKYGSYDLYVREKLHDEVADDIRDGVREAIVDARVVTAGLDRDRIDALTHVRRPRSVTVTSSGERETNEVFNQLLPAGFMVLLLVSVFTSGQYLMTTTIEEKSSRVVEVLLSAVSPMELVTGKVLGQMTVGLVLLVLYAGMGVAGLVAFAMLGMLDLWLLFYLLVFFVISYFVVASMMAAIGAAVNEMREAQTLMTPVMVVMMIPWLLWMPITQRPDSTFAVVASFLPPINTFVMMLRMTSTVPPPLWQVWVSIAIGAVSVYAALWFAAKVFRIGLLMYGKPPNFATLVRWARMA